MRLLLLFLLSACTYVDIEPEKQNHFYDFKIKGVLTENGLDTLSKDINGYYHLRLNRYKTQTIHRVTGVILKDGYEPFPPEKIEWKSNLYWWLLKGDTVNQIVRTYFNPLTGVLQPVIYPPLLAKKDELVPTINCCSYSGKNGEINTMIAPTKNMVGDTLIAQGYNYSSNKIAILKIVLE